MQIKLFVLLLISVVFLLLFSPAHASNDVLFEDNFESVITSWTIFNGNVGNPVWQIYSDPFENLNQVYGINLTGSNKKTWSVNGNSNWSDYRVEFQILGLAGVDKNFGFRVQNATNFTMYGLHLVSGGVFLEKFRTGVGADLASNTSYSFINNIWYSIKIEVVGNTISVYVNDTLAIVYADNQGILGDSITNGEIALVATTGANTTSHIRFDDIRVTDLGDDGILDVPFFSQNDPDWGTDIYDHLNPRNMNQLGCAVTSAAMVLNYFGIDSIDSPNGGGLVDLTPKTLNNWLISQPDGYLTSGSSGGQTNWYAIKRWAKTRHDLGEREATMSASTLLDFSSSNFAPTSTNELVNNDIENGQPDILRVNIGGGVHFLVSKGQGEGTYLINDPEDLEENLDNDTYNNQFTGVRRFYETATNLSGLLMFSQPNIDLIVVNSDGKRLGRNPLLNESYEEIDGGLYGYEPPIVEASNPGTVYNQGINLLDWPDPESGEYTVKIFAGETGVYEVQQIFYNRIAEAEMGKQRGLLNNGDYAEIKIIYDQNSGDVKVQKLVDFEVVSNDILIGQSLGKIRLLLSKVWLAELKVAEKLMERKKVIAGQKVLNNLSIQINRSIPWAIDEDTAKLLLEDLNSLKNF